MPIVEPTPVYHRDYLVRLPLPLAQLYIRAYNAKDPRGRHDNSFYLFECLIKLAACPLIAVYIDEVRNGFPRNSKLDKLLAQLALPSLGQWLGFLRECSRYFAEREDADAHPMGGLFKQLSRKRDDVTGAVNLYRQIKNGPDGKPSSQKSVSLLQLFDSLVRYRNIVFGHGANRDESFYDDFMGPLLFPAVNDVLREGCFDMLGQGGELVFVREVKRLSLDVYEVDSHSLVGVHGERRAPMRVALAEADHLLPNAIYLSIADGSTLVPMTPIMAFREGGLTEEVLFLNRDRNAKHVEYLSYTTGLTERDKSTAESMKQFLATVTGGELSSDDIEDLEENSRTLDPSQMAKMVSQLKLDDPSDDGLRIGDFRVLAEMGRGGMGIVYLARQLSLGRMVALKMLPPELCDNKEARKQFQHEVKCLAQFDHPNIVKILATGKTPAGQMYYAMEYVTGANLELTWQELVGAHGDAEVSTLGSEELMTALLVASRENREDTHAKVFADTDESDEGASTDTYAGRLTLSRFNVPRVPSLSDLIEQEKDFERRVVMMIRDAARAVHVLHEHEIVHRDIKPQNLVLTADGKRIVLMDFGSSKRASISGEPQSGLGFLGSLRYAAPEQLASVAVPVGVQADVRALGVILWELLTRRRLFEEANDETALASAVHQNDVPLLRSIDRGFDGDLEAIVARATERQVNKRIQSAGKLADYLDAYLENQPVDLRIPGLGEKTLRWCRRHSRVFSLVVAVAFACVVLLVAWKLYDRMLAAEWHAEQQRIVKIDHPEGLAEIPFPISNPPTQARITLGRMLFFDHRLSPREQSCKSCHDPDHGFTTNQTGHEGVITDVQGENHIVFRNAPTLLNISFVHRLFVDGRTRSLEDHAVLPLKNPKEMDAGTDEEIVARLKNIPGYVELFKCAFIDEEEPITVSNLAKAIAAYERTLLAAQSPYDMRSMTNRQKKGYEIFIRCGCHHCHDEEDGLFTDGQFHNVGIGFEKQERDGKPRDRGRFDVHKNANIAELFSFRTPSLRNLKHTAPYMHDGSMETIRDVLNYYNDGGSADETKEWPQTPLNLSDEELDQLEAFLTEGLASSDSRLKKLAIRPELPDYHQELD